MATHSSAVKAHRQNLARRERNRQYRTRLRGTLKTLRSALAQGDLERASASMSDSVSLVDKIAAKGIIHRNAAARHKSRLARALAKASAAS